jgi:hypothetical protein
MEIARKPAPGCCVLHRHGIYVGVLLLVSAVMVFLYGQIPYESEQYSDWDLAIYRAMAAASPDLAPDVPRPFAHRILGPYLVGLLPLPESAGFYLLTVISAITLVFLFYFFLCSRGIQRPVAALTTSLFIFNKYLFGFPVWDYFQVADALTLVYILLLFWSLQSFNWSGFGIVLVLGALTRETALLVIPVAFVYLMERRKLASEGKAIVFAAVPGLGVFALTHWLIYPVGGGLVDTFYLDVSTLISLDTWLRLLINPFVPLSLLPLVFWGRTLAFARENKHAVVFVGLVLLTALFRENYERLMAPAFIVFYLLIAQILQDHLYGHKAVLAVLIGAAILSSFHHDIARYPLASREWTVALSALSLLIATTASCHCFFRSASRLGLARDECVVRSGAT